MWSLSQRSVCLLETLATCVVLSINRSQWWAACPRMCTAGKLCHTQTSPSASLSLAVNGRSSRCRRHGAKVRPGWIQPIRHMAHGLVDKWDGVEKRSSACWCWCVLKTGRGHGGHDLLAEISLYRRDLLVSYFCTNSTFGWFWFLKKCTGLLNMFMRMIKTLCQLQDTENKRRYLWTDTRAQDTSASTSMWWHNCKD